MCEGEGVEVSYYHMLTFVGIQHFDICAILVFDLVTFRHYYVSTFFLSTKVGRIYVSKIIIFLIYELGKVGHRQFCRTSFTASFYHADKLLKICFKTKKLIIQIGSGLLGHPLYIDEFRCSYLRIGVIKRFEAFTISYSH